MSKAFFHARRMVRVLAPQHAFTDIAATQPGEATISGDGEPEQVSSCKVSGNLWSVLGVQTMLGRVFTKDEDVKGVGVASDNLFHIAATPPSLGFARNVS